MLTEPPGASEVSHATLIFEATTTFIARGAIDGSARLGCQIARQPRFTSKARAASAPGLTGCAIERLAFVFDAGSARITGTIEVTATTFGADLAAGQLATLDATRGRALET